MDFTYSIWILLLPLISFLVIGLPEFVNKKYSWSHKTAGLIGTCSLGLVAALSYYTAFQYFTADRLADGTFATFVPYMVAAGPSALRPRCAARPDFGDDAHRHLYGQPYGAHLLVRLYAR